MVIFCWAKSLPDLWSRRGYMCPKNFNIYGRRFAPNVEILRCDLPSPLPISFSVSCNVLEILVKNRLGHARGRSTGRRNPRHAPSYEPNDLHGIFSHFFCKLWDWSPCKFPHFHCFLWVGCNLSKKSWIHICLVVPDPVLGWLFCPVNILYFSDITWSRNAKSPLTDLHHFTHRTGNTLHDKPPALAGVFIFMFTFTTQLVIQ